MNPKIRKIIEDLLETRGEPSQEEFISREALIEAWEAHQAALRALEADTV